MSQDTTKKSGTKRKTTPTKRSVEPLKETTAERTSGVLKIFPTKKAEKPQVDQKPEHSQKPERGLKSEHSQKPEHGLKPEHSQKPEHNRKPEHNWKPEHDQKPERGQKAERAHKSQLSAASLAELKDNALNFARNHTKFVVFLGVVIFLLVGLYPPIRGYYHAVREHDELLLNQQKLEEDKKRLESEVNSLQTKEGIEEKAREQGYVSEGEESARVVGLDKKKDDNTAQHPEYPWYIKVGDFVFGFSPGNSGNTDAPKSANSDDSTSAPAPGESHEQKNSGEDSSSEGSDANNSKSESGNSH